MKKLFFLSASMAMLLAGRATAQRMDCGTDALHRQLLIRNPDYARSQAQERSAWAEWQNGLKTSKIIVSGKDTTYELPVVIHVIHSGEALGTQYNPSVATIDSMLDYLNKSWSATWPAYPDASSGGVNLQIRFARARRTPDCNPSDGINRIDGRVLPGYDANGVIYSSGLSGPGDSALKSISRWPTNDYYNIWIVKYLDGPSGYYAGYAYFPGPEKLDGTVIASRYVRPFTPGGLDFWYTIPHELGHAFGLQHTFNGSSGVGSCPPNSNCAVDGDGICDTEPHEFKDGTCLSGTNMCTGAPYAGVQHNLMNYSTCFDRFTPMQKEKVLFSLNRYRMGLVNSLGATVPDGSFVAPKAACIPGATPDNNTDTGPHNVSLGDMSTSSNGFAADGKKSYMDRSCIQQAAHLQKSKAYTIKVSSGYSPERVKVWIDYNNDGVFQATEVVLNHVGSFTTPNEVHSATLTVPASAVMKTALRMRVMADIYTAAEPDACTHLEYGQTEDYTVFIEEPSAIEEATTATALRLFPNPAQDIVYTDAATPVDISVWSMDGRLLLRQAQSKQVNITSLPAGLYLFKLSDPANGNITGYSKILKDH